MKRERWGKRKKKKREGWKGRGKEMKYRSEIKQRKKGRRDEVTEGKRRK